MSLRPEVVVLRICPRCGAAEDSPACSCPPSPSDHGWTEGEQPLEVRDGVALLRGVAPFLTRQKSETPEQWLSRNMDLVGHLHLLLDEGVV